MLPCPELDVRTTVAVLRLVNERRKGPVSVGADHEINVPDPSEEIAAQTLRHASDDPEDVTGALVALQFADSSIDSLLGVLSNGAGIDQHHVGVGRVLYRGVPLSPEQPVNELGIRHVHLAAVRFDIQAFHTDTVSICPTRAPSSRPVTVTRARRSVAGSEGR